MKVSRHKKRLVMPTNAEPTSCTSPTKQQAVDRLLRYTVPGSQPDAPELTMLGDAACLKPVNASKLL